MSRRTASFPERVNQLTRLWRKEGPGGIALRLRERGARSLLPPGAKRLPVPMEDFLRAAEVAAEGWVLPGPAPLGPDGSLTIAWVHVPPGPGAGGATTMFRMVEALERAGHTCVVYLYDQHGWGMDQHRRAIREWWPWVGAEIRDFKEGIDDCHAVFATSWDTAYAVLGSDSLGARFYFVQDFEPLFSPAGSEYLLAEATYRFGFHGVTAGGWLADKLREEYNMPADHFDFGCDLDRYTLRSPSSQAQGREGVCYYCRPSTPRRSHELAVLALELFARRHPEVPIHVFGEPAGKLPFAATQHGLLAPEELNTLYNRCVAGLVLSATNVSLIPHEMLAAGCIPVVNDARHNRMVLDNPHVAYAGSTPFEIADALAQLVGMPSEEQLANARTAAASVSSRSWAAAGAQVESIVRNVVKAQLDDEHPGSLQNESYSPLRLLEGG